MTRARRILAVTAGLFAAGAIVGALTGAVVAAVLANFLPDPARSGLGLDVVGAGAVFGAPLGAVLFPTAGWLLMRRVPLGKALLGTSIGTLTGGLVGWFLPIGAIPPVRTLLLATLGFAIAVVWLRRSASGDVRTKAGTPDA